MLSEGIHPKDVANLLDIDYARLKNWIRTWQKTDLINRNDRVDVDAGGNWHWSQHTAQVILSNANVMNLLTERELKLLEKLREGASYTEVIQANPDLRVAEREIRYKLQSHGNMSDTTTQTYRTRRQQLLFFLDAIQPENEEEIRVIEAVRMAEGNVNEASKMLQVTRGSVLYFLKQKGYYNK